MGNMRSSATRIVAAAMILASSGCSGHFSKASGTFASGLESATQVIDVDLTAVTKIERVDYLSRLEKPIDQPKQEFGRFACLGIDYGDWRNSFLAILTLGEHGETLRQVSTSPDADIGALWASIQRWKSKHLELELSDKIADIDACRRSVEALIELPVRERVGVLAVPPAAIVAIINAVVKAIEVSLRLTDDAIRTKALKDYIHRAEGLNKHGRLVDSNAVMPILLGRLAVQDWEVQRTAVLNDLGKEEKMIIPEVAGWLDSAALNDLLSNRKRAALKLPYLQFLELARIDPGAHRAKVIEAGLSVHRNLEEFDSLRTRKSADRMLYQLQEARWDLIRMAYGKWKAKETLASFLVFASAMKDLAEKAEKAHAKFD